MGSNKILRNVIDVTWRSDLAYVIGLIASDGYLVRGTNRVGITSKDIEIIDIFKGCFGLQNRIGKRSRSNEGIKKYFYIEFKSKNFYQFLLAIGLTPAKSKTIQAVNVPDEFFADFLRGLFDGDGSFWTTWDRRWPNSFVYYFTISSASRNFLDWLQIRLTTLYGVKGYIKLGAGVYTLQYTKGDTRKLFSTIYYQSDLPHLPRKYIKMKEALDFDREIKQNAHTPR